MAENAPQQLPEGVTLTRAGKHAYTHAFKLKVIERIKGGETARAVGEELGVHPTHVRQWVRGKGMDVDKPETGFIVGPSGNKVYSDAYKKEAVARLMSGEINSADLGRELDVRPSILSAWRRMIGEGREPYHKTRDPAKHKGGRNYKKEWARRNELMQQKKAKMTTQKKDVKRGSYTALYKVAALKRLKAGETAKQVADSLGIDISNVYNWSSDKNKQHAWRAAAGRKGGLMNKGKPKKNGGGARIGVSYGDSKKQVEETTAVLSTRMRDAVALLKHAKAAAYADLQNGVIKEFNEMHLLVLQALRTLTGE
jgi:transposase-like protein